MSSTLVSGSNTEMETPFDIYTIINHMVMACISGDVVYLSNETERLLSLYDVNQWTDEEIDAIGEVSLQASMDGHIQCLRYLHQKQIPLDVMCPIIAGCHGHAEIIRFCEKVCNMNCDEAWDRYFNWIVCNSSQTDNCEIILASEWINNYRMASFLEEECTGDTVACA